MSNQGTQRALEDIIKLGVQSGLIVLKQGTTPEAAKNILRNAVEYGISQIPENPTVSIGGQAVEVDLESLVEIVAPWIEAGISAMVESLSPATTEIVVDKDVNVQWVITE